MQLARLCLPLAALILVTAPLSAQRGGRGGHSSTHSTPRTYSAPRSRSYSSARPYRTPRSSPQSGTRDSRGRVKRSREARDEFLRQTGYPHGRPGYVVDHIVPLCAGGADAPSNMQWQTVAEAKAKDREERAECAHSRH